LPPPLKGHAGTIDTVAFSPDGQWLASGSRDQTARLWNLAGQPPVGEILQAMSAVKRVAFSPDGKTLATGTEDGKIRLWDRATRKPAGAPVRGRAELIATIAFSPDGKTRAAASSTAVPL